MVRWLLLGSLIAICFIRYLFVINSQVEVKTGDIIRLTGISWDYKIRVENRRFIILDKSIEIPDGDKVTLTGRVTGQVIDKFGRNIYLEEAQIENNYTPIFYKLRVYLQNRIMNWIPGDPGGLASGILLGGNQLLSYDTRRNFTRDGLSHIIAASGYNVVMVSGWLAVLGKRLKRKKLMISFGLLGTILYMLLAGLSASVIRAGIMSILSITALIYGRKSDAIWSLVITAVVMILVNPWYILDIGFQLSVMATLGVLLSSGSVLKIIFMVQLFTIPLILHHFGQLSVVAPLANILVGWTVPFIMPLTALGLVIQPVLYLAWPLLAYMLYVASWLSKFSFASLSVGQMSWGWVVIWYLVLAIVYNRYYAQRQITPDYR